MIVLKTTVLVQTDTEINGKERRVHIHIYDTHGATVANVCLFFSITGLGQFCALTEKYRNRPLLTPCTKINSNWITDLNIKDKNTKYSEDNIDYHYDLSVWKYLTGYTSK